VFSTVSDQALALIPVLLVPVLGLTAVGMGVRVAIGLFGKVQSWLGSRRK
jgi:hypothetical protein